MNLFALAWKSLLNRRGTALLTLIAIAVSVALLLGVEKGIEHGDENPLARGLMHDAVELGQNPPLNPFCGHQPVQPNRRRSPNYIQN